MAQQLKQPKSPEPKRKTPWAPCRCVSVQKLGSEGSLEVRNLPSQPQVSVLLATQVTCLRQCHTLPFSCSALEQSAFKSYTTFQSPPETTRLCVQSQAFWGVRLCLPASPRAAGASFALTRRPRHSAKNQRARRSLGWGWKGEVFTESGQKMPLFKR